MNSERTRYEVCGGRWDGLTLSLMRPADAVVHDVFLHSRTLDLLAGNEVEFPGHDVRLSALASDFSKLKEVCHEQGL